MKFDLHKYAVDWVTAAGHELDGITTEKVLQEVNDNLPTGTEWNDENMEEVEVSVDPITLDEADTVRRIIEQYLNK